MPSTLLPNGIDGSADFGTVTTSEQALAWATQPVPTADQEKTVILLSIQVTNISDDTPTDLIIRCYRAIDGGGDPPQTGLQIGGDLTTTVDFDDSGHNPVSLPILVFFVDNTPPLAGFYAITFESTAEALNANSTGGISLLSVGS